MGQNLYIVDAHSLIFQVFHAIPEMSAPDGRPTNAVFGFTRDLLYLIESKKADYLICAFDASGPTFRDTIYSEYKANRAPMPDNLRPQIDLIREVVDALRIPQIECAGFEADDVVATITREAVERGLETFICTGDKDARQLIGPHVAIYNIRKDEVFDTKSLHAEWGIRPDQVVDLLAMTGDTVDNVPGIAGVGPKTAAALLQEFGTLDSVLMNIDRVSGKKRQENLRLGIESSRRARELVALRSDVPIELNWDHARVGPFDSPRLADLFGRFGFRRLTDQFAAQTAAPIQWKGEYRAITNSGELRELVETLTRQNRVAIELLMSSPQPMNARLIGIALAFRPGEAWYVPVRAPIGDRSVPETEVLAILRPVFESVHCVKAAHNLKYHMIALRRAGIRLCGLGLDTMVADYLMEAGERSHTLEQASARYLRHTLVVPPELTAAGPLSRDLIPVAEATQFVAQSADIILRLSDILENKLKEEGLWPLYETVEGPLIETLADMEYDGVFIDAPLLERLGRDFKMRLTEIEREVFALAGGEFNIGSTIQLREVLFQKLKLPVVKRTRTGASTDQEVLERLANVHPLPALLIEHRQISKLITTYLDTLPCLINPETGRVHATFNQVVAATGRLSSSDPNLQNIPIRTELGKQIRQGFAARSRQAAIAAAEGRIAGTEAETPWHLLAADYSQIELRILAHLSGDLELSRAFAADQDIHNFVASQIYGVDADSVTSEMRRIAKTVNFGVVYGLSPFGLSARLGISQEEAEAFIASYFAKYQGVEQFIRDVLQRAQRDGCVTTILGRRRRIAGVRARAGRYLNQSEREAINTVVQGSAADMIKVAMINLRRQFQRDQLESRMLLQIHDELVFEIPDSELTAIARMVNKEMVEAIPLRVPVKVDIAVGTNWLDVQPYEMVELNQAVSSH